MIWLSGQRYIRKVIDLNHRAGLATVLRFGCPKQKSQPIRIALSEINADRGLEEINDAFEAWKADPNDEWYQANDSNTPDPATSPP